MNKYPSISKLASLLIWLMFLLMLPPAAYLTWTNSTILLEWNILPVLCTPVLMTVILDPLGTIFSCTVLLISANVLKFSTVYMREDKFIDRFTALVLLFILSMNMLIFFPHLIILLLGWDGLGIVSFVLVIYYQNPKSLAAGMITALTNRIGDVMLLLSIAWTLNQGQWNIVHMWESSFTSWQVAAITLAAMTKSAQMPFSSWLPAAMAAPTPVSALVHSSTLVTAGVFLLIRFFPFLSTFNLFTPFLLFISVSTTIMAGFSAITECDMKKIIALSTLSQLGMMVAAMGLGAVHLAFFHMTTHALFKALLFVCAGAMIHNHAHSQDLRWMGNIAPQMPVTASCMLLANLALCGFPFMSGFYSKDLIVESSLFYSHNFMMLALIMFAVGLTSFYSTRFSMYTVLGLNNSSPYMKIEESGSLTAPMVTLALASVVSGAGILWWAPLGSGTTMVIWGPLKPLPLAMVAAGFISAWIINSSCSTWPPANINRPTLHKASCSMWFLGPLSSQFVLGAPLTMSHLYLKSLDQQWLELVGGLGFNKVSCNISNYISHRSMVAPANFMLMSFVAVAATLAAIYTCSGGLK